MGKLSFFLSICTPIFSTASLIIVLAALFSTDWIRTQEKIPNPSYNGTGDKFKSRISKSGLLELCIKNPDDTEMMCKSIEYLGTGEYYPNPYDSTLAIEYTVRQSVFFFIVAGMIQIFGEIGYVYGHYFKDKRMFVFIGGAVFIVSGLVMMIGIVMYISIFKTEVGGKLRSYTPNVPPVLTFQYGCSFVLYVCGFLAVEITGTCAVLLFVSENQDSPVLQAPSIPYPYADYMMPMNPGVLYPCRMHPQVYLISGNPAAAGMPAYPYPAKYYEPPRERGPRKVKRVPNSPPYTPSSRRPCERHGLPSEWEYYNQPTDVQRTVGLQVDTMNYHHRAADINCRQQREDDDDDMVSAEYLPRGDDFEPFDLERLSSPISVRSGRDSLRKTTVV